VKVIRATLLFLLIASSQISAQSVSLDVRGKPLNKVLKMLNLEISFDDGAMSEYSITASKSFDNPEEALHWLFLDKPFTVEKVRNVFVIVPDNVGDLTVNAKTLANQRYIFFGTVTDSATLVKLEYATVCLLNADSKIIAAGITDSNGTFHIETGTMPDVLKISYVGYKTLVGKIEHQDGNMGELRLSGSEIELPETVKTARMVSRQYLVNYEVTPQMRNGAANAMELLNRIPNVYYDVLTDEILVNQQNNVLLLVDGVPHTQKYLKHLAPERVQAIEVVHASSGRFVSDDYAAIVQFNLKKDYTGIDINLSHKTVYNLTEGNSGFTESSPDVGIIYTANRFNFFGAYSNNSEKQAMYSTKALTYNEFQLISFPENSPNDLSSYGSNTLNGGVNYQVAERQLIGAQVDYSSGNASTHQVFKMRPADKIANPTSMIVNTTEIEAEYQNVSAALTYQGQINNRLTLYSDFTYNYYRNDIVNGYNQNDYMNYYTENEYDEYKNHTVFNVESRYAISSRLSLESGYSNIWRMYGSQSSQGRGFLDYHEYRNKAFAYFSFFQSDRFWLKTGIAIENIKIKGNHARNDYLRVLPTVQANYKINQDARLMFNYSANQSYPALYRLSPMNLVIDTFLTQIGNPSLKSALKHQIFCELTLWNKIKVSPKLVYIDDDVSEVYEKKEFKLYRTFKNIRTREYSIQASYNQAFGDCLRTKNALLYYYDEVMDEGIFNSLNGWTLQSEIYYYNQRKAAGVQVGYYRNMRKSILRQGFQMQNRDYWCVSLQKELWHNRISAALTYIPPLSLGVRYDRAKQMETPIYCEKTVTDMSSQKQMLVLKVNIRFERGSVKPVDKRKNIGKEERVW
jgi:hypothetical protein